MDDNAGQAGITRENSAAAGAFCLILLAALFALGDEVAARHGEYLAKLPPLEAAASLREAPIGGQERAPARIALQYALTASRAASATYAPDERKAWLTLAHAYAGRAAVGRPGWAEASVARAYISYLENGIRAPGLQDRVMRSYREAPYLSEAGQWRVAYGMTLWDALTPSERRPVIDEAVWLANRSARLDKQIKLSLAPGAGPVFLARRREVEPVHARAQHRAAP